MIPLNSESQTPHLTDRETEPQKEEVTCLETLMWWLVVEFKLGGYRLLLFDLGLTEQKRLCQSEKLTLPHRLFSFLFPILPFSFSQHLIQCFSLVGTKSILIE